MHLNAAVNQLPKISPIFKISGRAIDLVHDHPRSHTGLKQPEHFGEYRASAFCGGFAFFKAVNQLEAATGRIAINCVCLLLERDALLSLAGR